MRPRVRRSVLTVALALPVALVVPVGPASAATICVGSGAGCQPTLAAAVAAAEDGDTIRLGPGTYQGGIVIDSDITLAGAGARRTTIKGGGPVVQVGERLAEEAPTVTIKGVTITGGFTRTYPLLEPPLNTAIAAGGGIYVPPSADFEAGADLTVIDSVITGNRVSPAESTVFPPDVVPCPGDGCAFAASFGAGMVLGGPTRLVRTTVSRNLAGSAAASDDQSSNAAGAGIAVFGGGPLTMTDSTVADNVASVAAPNGRFAEGAGINLFGAEATITRSRITGNQGLARSSYADDPAFGEERPTVSLGGGLHNDVPSHVRITRSTISGNTARNVNAAGTSQAWGGGMHLNGTIDMTRSVVSGNEVAAGSRSNTYDAFVDGGAAEIDGDLGDVSTITSSSFTGNTMRAFSTTGDLTLYGTGIFTLPYDPGSLAVTDTQVSGNRAIGSTRGEVTFDGGGIWNGGGLDLLRTRVVGNQADLEGGSGTARGGGIFTGRYAPFPDLPATPRLSASGGSVTGNVIGVKGGLTATAGGIFTEVAAMLTGTSVVRNKPGPQCEGCDGGAVARRAPSSKPPDGSHRVRSLADLGLVR